MTFAMADRQPVGAVGASRRPPEPGSRIRTAEGLTAAIGRFLHEASPDIQRPTLAVVGITGHASIGRSLPFGLEGYLSQDGGFRTKRWRRSVVKLAAQTQTEKVRDRPAGLLSDEEATA